MSRLLAEGRVVRSRRERPEHCLALSGKGTPGSDGIAEAMEALTRAADVLRDPALRGAHAFHAEPPEVRLRAPAPGARGGAGWTVFVRVPAWVGASEVTEAVERVSRSMPAAKNIRLSPVVTEPVTPHAAPGRDRQPGQIRRRRTGPQHRARELR